MIKPTTKDIGRTVVYDDGRSMMETGVISSLGSKPEWVFVKYEGDHTSKLTMNSQLYFITETA
jgi:hypothetical protein